MQYAVGDVGVVVDIATLAGMMQPVSSKILKKLGFESHHIAIQLSRTVADFVPLRVARNYKNLSIKQVDTRHLLKSNKLKTQPPFFGVTLRNLSPENVSATVRSLRHSVKFLIKLWISVNIFAWKMVETFFQSSWSWSFNVKLPCFTETPSNQDHTNAASLKPLLGCERTQGGGWGSWWCHLLWWQDCLLGNHFFF